MYIQNDAAVWRAERTERCAVALRSLQRRRPGGAGSAVSWLVLALLACSATDVVTLTPPEQVPAGEPAEQEPAAEPEPLYAISTRVFGPNLEGETGYLTSVRSLAAGVTFDLSNAVEMSQGGSVFGRTGDEWVYWAADSEPVITRWSVGPEGTFTPGPSVSFAQLGLSSASGAAYSPIFSSDKSYFVDQEESRIVIWDPRGMSALGSIPLELERDGALSPTVFIELAVRGSVLLASVFWGDDNDWMRIGERTRLITIDTQTDRVVSTVDETRCNQLALGGQATDGTAYYSSRSFFTLPRMVFGEGFGVGSCSLRVVPPGMAFEQGYDVDLGALAGGRPAGDFTLINDQIGFLRVWHPELVGSQAGDWSSVQGAAGFRWWRWSIGSAQAQEIQEQDSAANTVQLRRVDDKVYALRYTTDFAATTLQEFGADGSLRDGLSGPGGIYGVIRVR
jgi:hypothetical protein